MIEVWQLIAYARTWLGTPYLHQGRTRFGVDCIGLVICVRDGLGGWSEVLHTPRNYRRNPCGQLLEHARVYMREVAKPVPGSVVLIRWPKQEWPAHAALVTERGTMIHAHQNVGRVVEVGYRSQWVRLTHSYWKIPGVRYE